jgi:hypothetical protein
MLTTVRSVSQTKFPKIAVKTKRTEQNIRQLKMFLSAIEPAVKIKGPLQ